MPLPRKTIRVLPNPWALVHHDHGPQGLCHVDTGGRGTDPSFVGAELDRAKTHFTEKREAEKGDHRPHRQVTAFRFPALNVTLDGPAKGFEQGIELPKTPYYLDRLRDGDLVPADDRTRSDLPCRFKSLAEAKAAGVAVFEANYGEGAFAEAFPSFGKKSAGVEQTNTGGGNAADDSKAGKGASK